MEVIMIILKADEELKVGQTIMRRIYEGIVAYTHETGRHPTYVIIPIARKEELLTPWNSTTWLNTNEPFDKHVSTCLGLEVLWTVNENMIIA